MPRETGRNVLGYGARVPREQIRFSCPLRGRVSSISPHNFIRYYEMNFMINPHLAGWPFDWMMAAS
jgi:hypothetical protein